MKQTQVLWIANAVSHSYRLVDGEMVWVEETFSPQDTINALKKE
jgi:hypothetical protein